MSTHQAAPESPDLVRLSKSKSAVDLSPNTIRKFHKEGLNLYKNGRVVFFSKSELSEFIRGNFKVIPSPVSRIA